MELFLQSIPPDAANQTVGSGTTLNELFLLNIISGLAIEVCFGGLIAVIAKLLSDQKNRKREKKVHIVASLTILGNIGALGYIASFIVLVGPMNQDSCIPTNFFSNFCSHLFIVSFDCLVLYKCYYISNRDKWVLRCVSLIVTNRVGWAIADLIQSHGYWDTEDQVCYYVQDPVTGLGYNSTDILSDCFATLAVLVISFKRFSLSSRYIQTMIQRTRQYLPVKMHYMWCEKA
ncbi:hypothetical protein BDR26DRAFT_877389 [Obelidium mucronatum]|nr:hypothetical protein BDR26DRAFT_877389 [Obelidium mucronatum]